MLVISARSFVIFPLSIVVRVAFSSLSANTPSCGSLSSSPRLRECSGPCKDCCHGVGGCLFAFQIFVIMTHERFREQLHTRILPSGDTSTEVIIASEPKAEETISLITSPS